MRSFPLLGPLALGALALGALSLVPLASAQSQALVLVGDTVPGLGTVAAIRDVEVNDDGSWIASVLTTGGGEVVLVDGAVLLKTGDPLGTSGLTFFGTSSVTLNAQKESVFSDDGQAIHFGTTPLVVDQGPTTAPGYAPGTLYTRLFDAKINDARLVAASVAVDDPTIPGFWDRSITLYQTDAAGALLSETVLVKEGDQPAGVSGTILNFPESRRGYDLNAGGDVLTQFSTSSGTGVLLNGALLAQAGDQSPVFGEAYGNFYDSVALGDAGDYAYLANYAGGIGLVWNGVEVARVGETTPAFAPYALESYGFRFLDLDEDGRVYWFADWDDVDETRDTALLRDYDVLVREGESVADGQVIDELEFEHSVSPNGRYLSYQALLADGRFGAFLLDLEGGATPIPSCLPNAGVLDVTSSSVHPGSALGLNMSQPQNDQVSPIVAVSGSLAAAPPCGVVVPGIGEVLIGTPFLTTTLLSLFPFGSTLAVGSIEVPDTIALVGATFFVQGAFLDVQGLTPAEPVRLTDAFEITIAP